MQVKNKCKHLKTKTTGELYVPLNTEIYEKTATQRSQKKQIFDDSNLSG